MDTANIETIAFGTDGWRDTREALTPIRLQAVAAAVSTVVAERGRREDPVAVGYDARAGASEAAREVAAGLAANGHDVLFAERDCPTPALAYAVVDRDLAGALTITASHNPPSDSGVKFIPEDGAPARPKQTDAIETALQSVDIPPLAPKPDIGPKPLATEAQITDGATESPVRDRPLSGHCEEVDFCRPHVDAVLERLGADLEGVTVAYDAMYGSGRGCTDAALAAAGADVIRLRCGRDPTFGGGAPNPTPGRLAALTDRVVDGPADIGIANDGDADRVAVVTEDGPLDANRLFAVLYDYLLAATDTPAPAVRTVSTTFLIDRIADAHGTTAVETPVGFKWVAETMAEHDALIGGEESGGFTIRDHIRLKDGVLTGVLAAMAAADQPLTDRLATLVDTYGDIKQARRSLECPDAKKAPTMAALTSHPPESITGTAVDEINDADGSKFLLADGAWLLVRPSGTEAKLRIYAEAATDDRVEALLTAGEALINDARESAELD
ncbi:phosphohexomutase (phosphoglucomutase / phosphomannomutase) [Natronomonas pharaonis DSM 2160]|uniref:Phosphohexomutase (Phosphoglucomutase / phosphomannomutase) n=1 Tax=Natronomonas pharaonis (strain ATCC 35678 / DSM 2160 / CIP 103997 / JCM 8858 / NBRC 14720 / NCIMB 2260 / Gabara) TaxID=348780 RepID=A0A1U7EYU9_NATPD|nr:phosphoglucomutase/phosphomannomutase family protein [Natronomonas pharaonis]CAI50429.1 phosphohexomutase (phosphoglucomutase / phosphomannomutase) [Natronomonas pharaonis DSM 2160]